MATILLNGVETDVTTLTGTGLADRLTARGGADGLAAGLDGLEADLDDGDDLIELDANGEDADVTLNGAEGNDVITVIGGDPDEVDFIFPKDIGGTISGDAGDDTISFGDGLAVLTGTVNGGDDEDTITVANARAATISGGNDNDAIKLGFADGYGTAAGSRAEATITNTTVSGGDGDDNIVISAALTDSDVEGNDGNDNIIVIDSSIDDSKIDGGDGDDVILATDVTVTNYVAIKGQEGDDTITINGVTTGAMNITGNAGDDDIDVSGLILGDGIEAGDVTIRGGFGHDTIRGGNGQDLYGGLGADIFSIEAAGGATIKDYDRLDINVKGGENYDCDDQIQIDGHKIFLTTYNYNVDVDINSSATNFTGSLKVRGYGESITVNAVASTTIGASDYHQISATAVAKALIVTSSSPKTLPQITYNSGGLISATGLANNTFIYRTSEDSKGADGLIGNGIGSAVAFAEGYWTQNTTTSLGKFRSLQGQLRTIAIKTYSQFSKADFNVTNNGGTSDSAKATRTISFTDVVSGVVKNHSAVYGIDKTSSAINLYDMNFGTALFKTVTTGTAYQVVTSITNNASPITTKTTINATANISGSVSLGGTFKAWKANLRSDSGTVTSKITSNGSTTDTRYFNQIKLAKQSASVLMPIITSGGGALTTSRAYTDTTSTTILSGSYTKTSNGGYTEATVGSYKLSKFKYGQFSNVGSGFSGSYSAATLLTATYFTITSGFNKLGFKAALTANGGSYNLVSATATTTNAYLATSADATGTGNILRFITDGGHLAVLGGFSSSNSSYSYAKTVNGSLVSTNANNFYSVSGSQIYSISTGSGNSTIDTFSVLGSTQLLWSSLQARGLLSVTTTAVLGGDGSQGINESTTFSNNNPTGTTITEKVGVNNVFNFYQNTYAAAAALGIKIQVTTNLKTNAQATLNATTKTKTFGYEQTVNGAFAGVELGIKSISNFPTTSNGSVISNSAFTGSLDNKFMWTGNLNPNNLQSKLGIGEVYSKTIGYVTRSISASTTTTPDGQVGYKSRTTWSSSPLLVPVFAKTIRTSNFDTRNAAGSYMGESSPMATTSNGLFELNTYSNRGFFSGSTFTTSFLAKAGFGSGVSQKLGSAFSTTNGFSATKVPFRVLFFDNDTSGNGLYVISGLADYKSSVLVNIDTEPTTSSAMGGRHTIVKVDGNSTPIALSDINLV